MVVGTPKDLTKDGADVVNGRVEGFIHQGGDVLLLACGALARELLALIKMNNWQHLALHCLPAQLHLFPEKIVDAIEIAVEKNRHDYKKIYLVYADCGTGGLLQKKCAELDIEMVKGPHCYAFFEGIETFDRHADDDLGAFYLTDFMVRQFEAFVWKAMGLDRYPELRDQYFAHYKKLVYQAQIKDPKLEKQAQEAAKRLGLAYEYRFTGYGDLEKTIRKWAEETQI